MVRQKKWSEMSPPVRERARAMVERFERSVCSETAGRPRRGIIKMRDAFGTQRRIFMHQAVAVHRLVLKNHETEWAQRKSAMLAIHDLGLGKTLSAILGIATVRNGCPDPATCKTLVLCPKAVLTAWADALQSWTTLGDLVLVGHRQAQLTEAALDAAHVILTTPEVLVAAFKTFVYQGTSEADRKKPKMQRFHHGVKPTDTARRAALGGALPPIHPIFALLTRQAPALALTVVDELHLYSNPTSLVGHVIAMFCTDSVYTLGLTGTPVTNDPKQLAHLAKALNAQPGWLQQPRWFLDKRDAKRINRKAVDEFHDLLVDRVDGSFVDLPEKRYVVLEYDPWVGREPDGRTNASVVTAHNHMLASAQKLVASNATEALEMAQGKWGQRERAVFTAAVALGHYEFCGLLGVHGAAEFKSDPTLFDEAVAVPSECVKLVLRMLRSRQAAGHPRIVVYSESVTQLKILEKYLADKGVGSLFFYDGNLSGVARGKLVHDFLQCASGVLLLSSAGAIGLTLCPGCEVLFSVGSLPWNATTVDQAFGRVHRIGQKLPVEIVQFVARGGITAAKMALHDDKRERLERAARDGDFSAFGDDSDLWRWQLEILSTCGLLDERGNYKPDPQAQAAACVWQRAVEAMDAKGLPPPPPPANLPKPPRLAQDVELPPVSFPIAPLAQS